MHEKLEIKVPEGMQQPTINTEGNRQKMPGKWHLFVTRSEGMSNQDELRLVYVNSNQRLLLWDFVLIDKEDEDMLGEYFYPVTDLEKQVVLDLITFTPYRNSRREFPNGVSIPNVINKPYVVEQLKERIGNKGKISIQCRQEMLTLLDEWVKS